MNDSNVSIVLRSQGAVRRNPSTATALDKEVEATIIKRFHLAGDRDDGRKERQKIQSRSCNISILWNNVCIPIFLYTFNQVYSLSVLEQCYL